jgi:uncharacterized membrane protein YoaK (UPF0700 family)
MEARTSRLAAAEHGMAEDNRRPPFGDREATLACLAFASASSDVLAFLFFHQVFTSAMTGNTALLGLALGQGQAGAAAHSGAALGGFVLGIAAGTVVEGEGKRPQALTLVLLLEALCLGLFAALWYGFVHPVGALVYALVVLAALGMGLQIVAARQVNLPGIPTVVVTTTLTSVIVNVIAAVRRRQAMPVDAWRQAAVFASYGAGAVAAGAAAAAHHGILVLLPVAAVLAALALRLRA